MKKEAKVEYGITITKPWSREMYDHNEMVANAVCILLEHRWENALNAFEEEEELGEEFMSDTDWSGVATAEMKKIQRAITGYGFGFGYSVADVHHIIEGEIDIDYIQNSIREDLESSIEIIEDEAEEEDEDEADELHQQILSGDEAAQMP
jgi:hypothetical protein